jgi:hypothetical protein
MLKEGITFLMYCSYSKPDITEMPVVSWAEKMEIHNLKISLKTLNKVCM